MFRKGIAAGLMVFCGVLATARGADDVNVQKTPYVHSVVFYLKKDAPKDAAANMIADCHSMLAKIPSVKGLWVGRPADKASPDVAVKDFSVGLLVMVENFEGLDAYLKHATHVKFVDKHLPNVEKVLVYDYVNQAK